MFFGFFRKSEKLLHFFSKYAILFYDNHEKKVRHFHETR